MDRLIFLDTETTGMNQQDSKHYLGHRVIEIGAVEVINRKITQNNFHVYLKPDRLIDQEAIKIHGITDEQLADAPKFEDIYLDFIKFIKDATVIIHNAPFDVGFLNYEFSKLNLKDELLLENLCEVVDSLKMARQLYPGKRNSLDALCERLMIDNSSRVLHGALLDAQILADVYLAMTGGQINLFSDDKFDQQSINNQQVLTKAIDNEGLVLIEPSTEELQQHKELLELINKKSINNCLWNKN